MAPRITYRRQVSYNTDSNRIKKIKTPGGRVIAQYVTKKASPRVCGEPGCGKKLTGLPTLRPYKYSSLKRRENRVSRAYGGSLCGECVKTRFIKKNKNEK